MRRAVVGWLGGLLLLAPAAAHAEGGYEADWVTQTPPNGTKIETGERLKASLAAKNVGTKTWGANVRLATGDGKTPHGAVASPFADESWITPNRIVDVAPTAVAVGATGRFDFVFKGPATDGERTYRQFVLPVAEGEAWMDGSSTWPTGRVYFDLVSEPARDPTVSIASAPPSVVAGEPLPVSATAADNVRVTAVAMQLDGGQRVTLTGAPYDAQVPTAGLAPGPHTLTVAAVDGAGHIKSATAPVTLTAPTGAPNGTPSGPAKLTGGFGAKRRGRAVVGYGRRPTIRGRLRTPQGAPIAGASLQVLAHREGTRSYRSVGTARTGAQGRYGFRLPAGASRRVRVVYRALTLQAGPTAARTLRAQTRAGVQLRVRRHGRRVRLEGRVLGRPIPRQGVLVSLQGRQDGDRWRPFRTVRARRGHRGFATSYRFSGGGRFKLRAVVSAQGSFPYERGVSRSRRVTIR